MRDRLWFFGGYQHLRDSDSQPGTDPAFPRTYQQDKYFVKLTWRFAPGWQLPQSFHDEFWVNPELATVVKPFEATQRRHATVPAMTFGHLMHTVSANTVWDLRAGRFVYDRKDDLSTGFSRQPAAESAARCRHAHPAHRRVPRLAWIESSGAVWRWRLPTSARTAAISSGGLISGVSIGRRQGRCRMVARCRCRGSRARPPNRRFLLTNHEGYALVYNGLVLALEKRYSNGWQAFGSYTWSRASGLPVSSAATAAAPQVSTIAARRT